MSRRPTLAALHGGRRLPLLAVAGVIFAGVAEAAPPGVMVHNEACLDSDLCGTSTNSGSTSTSGSATYGTFTVPSAGDNKLLVIGMALLGTDASADSCTISATYNGAAQTLKRNHSGGWERVALWATTVTGDGNDYNIVVSRSGCTSGKTYAMSASAMLFENVGSTGTATSAGGTGTSMTTSANSIEGGMVVSMAYLTCDVAASSTTPTGSILTAYTRNVPTTDTLNRAHMGYVAAADGGTPGTPTSQAMAITAGCGSSARDWSIAAFGVNKAAGTAVRLIKFAAWDQDGSTVDLDWQTATEIDNLGFNLYRDDGLGRVRINPSPIIGSALTAGAGISLGAGNRYRFEDFLHPLNKHRPIYWLEDIDLSGRRTLHGPVRPVQRPIPRAPEPPPAPRSYDVPAALARVDPPESIVEPPFTAPALVEPGQTHPLQWELAGTAALKIGVDRDGWYQLTGAELTAAGLDPRSDPRRLSLFVEGAEVPLEVSGAEDGVLNATDTVGFYGKRINAASTDTRVYWLSPAGGQARRLSAAPAMTTVPAAGPGTFLATAEWRPRTVYVPALLNGEEDNFFGPLVSTDPITHSFQAVDGAQVGGQASLEVGLQGVSYVPHEVTVEVGGQTLGEVTLDERERRSAVLPLTAPLPAGPLTVTLRSARPEDTTLVDFVRLRYPQPLVASSGRLAFSAPAGSAITVGGFAANEKVAVLDVSEAEPSSVGVEPASAGGELRLIVPAGAGERSLLARASSDHLTPVFVKGNTPSQWSQAQPGGDLLVIGAAELLPAIEPLAQLRRSEGWTLASVTIEDVYDEFSFGMKHPAAIRALVARALASWQHKPRAVILLGDATTDPRDRFGKGPFDLVPTKLVPTFLIETASDDWFTDFDADGVADVPVGRLPVRTRAEADALVQKLVGAPSYRSAQEAAAAASLVFISGDPDDKYDFPAVSRATVTGVKAPWRTTSIVPGPDRAAQFRQVLHARPPLVSYTGHGSQQLWADGMLSTSSVTELGDDGPGAFWMTLTCLNGFFHDAFQPSLAESLLARPQGGAFGVWASSALTEAVWHRKLGESFVHELTARGVTAGEAARRAKLVTADSDTRASWILFGDPTWRLRAFPEDLPAGRGDPSAGGSAAAESAAGEGRLPPAVPGVSPQIPPAGCACQLGAPVSGGPATLVLIVAALLIRRNRARRR